MKKRLLHLLACGSVALLGLAACNDDDPAPENCSLTLDRPQLTLAVGQTYRLTATLQPETDGAVFAWSSDNETVATVTDGLVEARAEGSATVTVRWADAAQASCQVSVSNDMVVVTGIALDQTHLEIGLGGSYTFTVTFTPENATDKSVAWSSSAPTSVSVEQGVVKALDGGTATITAVTPNGCSASCTVMVIIPPQEKPKIGDYYYSDGTWSDGGLLSIDAGGLNPVWADPKPAPEPGKTVVGIVFQTDPERIADSDKANGHTRGYAVAVRNAHGPDKLTTCWSFDYEFDCLKNAKTSDVWYWNVNGYVETMTVRDTYGADISQCPAFDWTLNDFPLAAPAGTSGWFLPSTGQLWDMIANLCGHEVAAVMLDWSTQKLNAGYGYASETVSYDTLERFNRTLSQLSAADKEELFITSSEFYSTCSLWASTPSTAGETACIINIGTKGTIELYEEYSDGDCVARPILAF